MNFLLNINVNLLLNGAIASLLLLLVPCAFWCSKKFISCELEKFTTKNNSNSELYIVLGSGIILSTIMVMLGITLFNLLATFFLIPIKLCKEYKNVLIFSSIIMSFSYALSIIYKDALAIHKEIVKMVSATFLFMFFAAVIMHYSFATQERILLEYGLLAFVLLAYTIRANSLQTILKNTLLMTDGSDHSPSAKLILFLNNKIATITLLFMCLAVVTNYKQNNVDYVFFKNLQNIFCVLFSIFSIQIISTSLINSILKQLRARFASYDDHAITGSLEKSSFIWVGDIILIAFYFFTFDVILQFRGINLQNYIFHDTIVVVGCIIAVSVFLYNGFDEFSNIQLQRAKNDNPQKHIKLLTFMPVLKVIFNTLLCMIAVLMSLSSIGINIAPILATFTVLSAAIGLAAKDTIQSFLQGIALLLEESMFIGELVRINGLEGIVENLSIRSVQIRELNGTLHTIPYNIVNAISNFSRDYAISYFDTVVRSEADVKTVSQVLINVVAQMRKEEEYAQNILSDAVILGLLPFNLVGLQIHWSVKTTPDLAGKLLTYELFRRLNAELDARGISLRVADAVSV